MISIQGSLCADGAYLDALVEAACRREVPLPIAEEANRATVMMLRRSGAGLASPSARRRARAYFDAVVRRRVMRDASARCASACYIVAAEVADLQASGRDGEGIWQEIERGWRDRVSGEVLEHFRMRLCG
ncbi:MAG: hypothetical protein HGA39_03580 [Coriobacteriia bacterium]|nr:hypothetical protein [Coriobacteriia bacterium]